LAISIIKKNGKLAPIQVSCGIKYQEGGMLRNSSDDTLEPTVQSKELHMKTRKTVGLIILGVLVLALALSLGCGTKEQSEPKTATTDEKSTTYGEAVEQAKEVAGEVAALANPTPGIDPVCGMKLEEGQLVVEVAGAQYGFCAAACADAFKADPAKYLAAATGHEGHDH
jgi:YHS domain-containing protein